MGPRLTKSTPIPPAMPINPCPNDPAIQSMSAKKLAEALRCFICMEKPRDAHLCPHCSKLCCYICIRRWLKKESRCPHCREWLRLESLVKCRWVEEVTQQLDTLQGAQCDDDGDRDRCRSHQEVLSVYCSTCECCICHKCTDTHTDHTCKPLDQVYETRFRQIVAEVTPLRRRLLELTELEKSMGFLVSRSTKDERMIEIRNTLRAQKSSLTQEIEQLEALLQNIETQLYTRKRSELIAHSAELSRMIHEVRKTPAMLASFVTNPSNAG